MDFLMRMVLGKYMASLTLSSPRFWSSEMSDFFARSFIPFLTLRKCRYLFTVSPITPPKPAPAATCTPKYKTSNCQVDHSDQSAKRNSHVIACIVGKQSNPPMNVVAMKFRLSHLGKVIVLLLVILLNKSDISAPSNIQENFLPIEK